MSQIILRIETGESTTPRNPTKQRQETTIAAPASVGDDTSRECLLTIYHRKKKAYLNN